MEWANSLIWPALASAIAMTAIVAVRYVVTSGGFAWLTRRLHPGLYSGLDRQIRSEIKWSILSAALYGMPAGVLLWGWDSFGWTRLYTDRRPLSAGGGFPARCSPISFFTTHGFTGPIAGCTARPSIAGSTRSTMPVIHRPPGRQ